MPTILEGKNNIEGTKIGVVVSRFNEEVTQRLFKGCYDTLMALGMKEDQLTIVWVPGALEIPFIAQELILSRKVDGVIALGAVIQGETHHYDTVCEGLVQGLIEVQLKTQVPVALGVLTTETKRQAIERSGGRRGNKGAEAAEVVLKLLDLKGKLKRTSK